MYVPITIGAICLVVGFGLGDRLATGRYEAQLHLAASAHRAAQDRAIAEASEKLEAEARRAVQAAEERGRRSVVAREIVNEIHVIPDVRDCSWTPDQRLRIERLYTTYGVEPAASD